MTLFHQYPVKLQCYRSLDSFIIPKEKNLELLLQFFMGIVGLFFHILFLSPMRWIRQLLQIKDAVTCGLLGRWSVSFKTACAPPDWILFSS